MKRVTYHNGTEWTTIENVTRVLFLTGSSSVEIVYRLKDERKIIILPFDKIYTVD